MFKLFFEVIMVVIVEVVSLVIIAISLFAGE